MLKNPSLAGMLVFAYLCLSACQAVTPWQRGILAKPSMALEPHPYQSAFREHIYGSRESASGGSAAKGGGCGCY